MHFDFVEGFSRPDWKSFRLWVAQVSKEENSTAWNVAVLKWLKQLASDLGGDSQIYRSEHFFSMSDIGAESASTLLVYAESARSAIVNALKAAAWTGYSGKHVLLIFSDIDDYFGYIAYYYPEGTHALSSGVCIRRDYVHVALPFVNSWSAEHTIAHELTHNLLAHLQIPTWLNEGLAVTAERLMSRQSLSPASRQSFYVDQELANQHRAFWNEDSIQSFWAGRSVHIPGESNELSYSLAEIFVRLISESGNGFVDFIQAADYRDAGQDAAIRILNCDLGEMAARFLGPGDWRPKRKAIAEIQSSMRDEKK